MQRVLLVSLLCGIAACASNTAGKPGTTSTAAPPPAGTVCNDEVVGPRGSAGERCYTKRQLDDQKRFANDTKLDPTPRPTTYNN
jgi:hypothetical protein